MTLPVQTPRDIAFYLSNKQVSRAAKDYYNHKFPATDDDRTFSILDSMKTRNDQTRPFYIYLVSKMMETSDGALSEVIGIACKDEMESRPDEVLEFLYFGYGIADPKFIGFWAKAIAGEFQIDCEGKEKTCISSSFKKAMSNCRGGNGRRLTELYKKIESFRSNTRST